MGGLLNMIKHTTGLGKAQKGILAAAVIEGKAMEGIPYEKVYPP